MDNLKTLVSEMKNPLPLPIARGRDRMTLGASARPALAMGRPSDDGDGGGRWWRRPRAVRGGDGDATASQGS